MQKRQSYLQDSIRITFWSNFSSAVKFHFNENSNEYKYFSDKSEFLCVDESTSVFLRHNISTQMLEGLNEKIKNDLYYVYKKP